jgi:hypothetical protein
MLIYALAAVLWVCAALLWGGSGYVASEKPHSPASSVAAIMALLLSVAAFTLTVLA